MDKAHRVPYPYVSRASQQQRFTGGVTMTETLTPNMQGEHVEGSCHYHLSQL